MIELAIIIPCFNECEVLSDSKRQLADLRGNLVASGKISEKSSIWFIDDGSTDATWQMIERFCLENGFIHGIKLSRNWGHQAAILSGLLNAPGDAIISIDADLQDDLNVIEKMLAEFAGGKDIVYGVKIVHGNETKFKLLTAGLFYRVARAMGVNIISNHADFRLMSRRAIEALRDYREVNIFLRGIVPLIGLKTSQIPYELLPRKAGKTKYSLRKMSTLAFDGITSFSAFPLRLITITGFLITLVSFLFGVWIAISWLFSWRQYPVWSTILIPIYFLGGIQLLAIGIVGEYISRMYMETKGRPRYIIEKVI